MTAIDDFASRARAVRGILPRSSQFGSHPPAWWFGSREIAHAHRGHLEVRLTRAVMARMRDELARDARVDYRRPGSDWVRLQLRTADDVELAMRLLRMAKKANSPAS
ncbi:MAG: luciferase family protein [Candidatus Limnocylindria bacterium]